MPTVKANGLNIEVERFGDPSAEPILLIRGLGSQLVHWPAGFVSGLVENGFHVIAFDNRDTGLSQKMIGNDAAPYTLRDMAADAVGVLDACAVDSAHVLGISMGGKILQHMALDFPERVRTATIVMSSSDAPGLSPAAPEVREALSSPTETVDRDSVVDHWLATDRLWASPGFPFDEVERRKVYRLAYDRCYDPQGVARQFAAMMADRDRYERLPGISIPTLVVHGTDDAIYGVDHGRDLAARIPDAELLEVEGMGHDLEGPVPGLIVLHVARLAQRAR